MHRGSEVRNHGIKKIRNRSHGYILISLMLFLSLLAIAALAVLPSIAFQVRRDREEEMIHRGMGYSRGIRRFYKKFGRYPTRIEDLENTNNLRFIRKRYKDPITGNDFKILHMSDVQLAGVPGLIGAPGGTIPGQGGLPGAAGAAGMAQATAQQVATAQQAATAQQVQQVTTTDTTNAEGGDSGNPSNPTPGSSSSSSPSSSSSGFGTQVFGGGPMLGVVSTSKQKTVREFCKKSHYNDWKFIYDPSSDLGASPNSPWCPLAAGQAVGLNPNQTGASQPQPNAGPQGATPSPAQPNPSTQQ